MIFSIVSTYEKYSEIDVESMLNPQTNKQEPMVLELYQKKGKSRKPYNAIYIKTYGCICID